MLKATKCNKSKKNTKNATAAVAIETKSTIKKFFKTAPRDFNVCAEEKECSASDSNAVFVQALKGRLKSYNGNTKKENTDIGGVTVQNKHKDVGAVESNTNVQHDQKRTGIEDSVAADRPAGRYNREGAGVVDSSSDDEADGNAAVSAGRNTGKLCGASCDSLREKYKDLKKSHYQLCFKHCEILTKYEQLVETLNALQKADPSNPEESDTSSPTDNVFTPNQIRVLESFPLEKKKDSTFILQCIEYAYKDHTSTLMNKTLYGTLERKEFGQDGAVVVRPAKDPLTPEKATRIEELFVKRVTKSNCLAAEFAERIKTTNINRLIASAIRNVSNKEKPKQSKKNVNLNL